MGKKGFKTKIVAAVVEYFMDIISTNLFPMYHPITDVCNNMHELQILKYIVNAYLDITYGKKKTLLFQGSETTIRHKLSKTVLFYNV